MLNTKPIEKVLFLDIETVPQSESFAKLSPKMQDLFKLRFSKEVADIENKTATDKRTKDIESLYAFKGSLYPEFAKIVCISVGVIDKSKDVYELKTMSITGTDDRSILSEVMTKVKAIYTFNNKSEDFAFCAHNGKIFDFPFMAKRFIINGLELPKALDMSDKKPWDLVHLIDTKEVWKFGVYDNNASLDLLAATFGIESSKDEMDGSMVKDVFYKENDLNKIAKYCEKDILALATIYLRMKGIQNQLITKK
jgi:uncharacterized protein YprB with RNaseH-like and TPR domain